MNRPADPMRRPSPARRGFLAALLAALSLSASAVDGGGGVEVSSLSALAEAAAQDGREIRLKPGVYKMSDYLTAPVMEGIRAEVAGKNGRPPVPMLVLRGSNNRIDATEAVIEIDTSLYRKQPPGYRRSIIVRGSGNTIVGLTVRNTGPNEGSGGNTLSLEGERTTLEDATVHVFGSYPYGYGDLFGKGGPNLLSLQKQSGIQVLGSGSVLRRCRVYSRAFGHCFYIQQGGEIRLEDCYAEGQMRPTDEMLAETTGPAFDLGFRSVYENRDGWYAIAPGYTKSLSEDGFRTYGNAGRVALVNCTSINTRAGFEIGAPDNAPQKTSLENCVARGCERGFLIGSQTALRRCQGDIAHGPLLYLRGGRDSDVELELSGGRPLTLVHAVATLAGENHRVKISSAPGDPAPPALPILLGFAMPEHGEMSSPIRPAPARRITLINEIPSVPVITGPETADCEVHTAGRTFTDAELRKSPGAWGAQPTPEKK